jgi:hypothetical protein
MDGVLLEVHNQKEWSYAWILILQLVTSEPEAVAYPEAQPKQPFLVLQCPGTSWHPPAFFWLIVCMTSLVMH